MLSARYTNIIYLLLSSGLLAYGLFTGKWPVFPLVYLWWWEGVLYTLVDSMATRWQGNKAPVFPRLFPYLIYWIILVVFLGFIAGGKDGALTNLEVIFFHNSLFNLCLLLLILHAGYRLLRQRPDPNDVLLLQLRIHVILVLGGGAAFLSQRFAWDRTLLVGLVILGVKLLLDFYYMAKPSLK